MLITRAQKSIHSFTINLDKYSLRPLSWYDQIGDTLRTHGADDIVSVAQENLQEVKVTDCEKPIKSNCLKATSSNKCATIYTLEDANYLTTQQTQPQIETVESIQLEKHCCQFYNRHYCIDKSKKNMLKLAYWLHKILIHRAQLLEILHKVFKTFLFASININVEAFLVNLKFL